MYSRWANFAVIVLWLATMTWLVTKKVLPPLLVGEPPNSLNVVTAREKEPLVGWRVWWNGEPIGWALSLTEPMPDGSTEIRSRVGFTRLPLDELTPGWIRTLFEVVESAPARIQAAARSTMVLDSTGRLSRVESSVRFEPFGDGVSMTGHVEGRQLNVSICSRGLTYDTEVAIDPEAVHGDILSPQTQLPGLREGQTWTVEVCSPLCSPNRPVEVLQATVVGREELLWRGQRRRVWLVEYREASANELRNTAPPRGRLWVEPDGTVLAEEVSAFSSRIKFVRMGEEEAAALADEQDLVPVGGAT